MRFSTCLSPCPNLINSRRAGSLPWELRTAMQERSQRFIGHGPNAWTIVKKFKNLWETGTIKKQGLKTPSLRCNLRVDDLAFMTGNPQASVRDVAAPITTSHWWILNNLGFHPYHLNLHQNLEERDLQDCPDFLNWVLTKCDGSPNFLSNVIWAGEVSSCRNGQVNLHNAHYWSDCNPHWVKRTWHQ